MWEYNYNYLSHHGVKGQKWGVRRYQYEDGSLTPDGRVHYGYGQGSQGSQGITKNNKNIKGNLKNITNKIKNFKITDKQKDVAKKVAIGAAIVGGTLLVAYGGKKIHDISPKLINNAKNKVNKYLKDPFDNIKELKQNKMDPKTKERMELSKYTKDRLAWEQGDRKTPPPIPTESIHNNLKKNAIENAKRSVELAKKDPEWAEAFGKDKLKELEALSKANINDKNLEVKGLNVSLNNNVVKEALSTKSIPKESSKNQKYSSTKEIMNEIKNITNESKENKRKLEEIKKQKNEELQKFLNDEYDFGYTVKPKEKPKQDINKQLMSELGKLGALNAESTKYINQVSSLNIDELNNQLLSKYYKR